MLRLLRVPGVQEFANKMSHEIQMHITSEDLCQRCPEATAHSDFASYSCSNAPSTNVANVVIFADYSSQCTVYFEKCGQRCLYIVVIQKEGLAGLIPSFDMTTT